MVVCFESAECRTLWPTSKSVGIKVSGLVYSGCLCRGRCRLKNQSSRFHLRGPPLNASLVVLWDLAAVLSPPCRTLRGGGSAREAGPLVGAADWNGLERRLLSCRGERLGEWYEAMKRVAAAVPSAAPGLTD